MDKGRINLIGLIILAILAIIMFSTLARGQSKDSDYLVDKIVMNTLDRYDAKQNSVLRYYILERNKGTSADKALALALNYFNKIIYMPNQLFVWEPYNRHLDEWKVPTLAKSKPSWHGLIIILFIYIAYLGLLKTRKVQWTHSKQSYGF